MLFFRGFRIALTSTRIYIVQILRILNPRISSKVNALRPTPSRKTPKSSRLPPPAPVVTSCARLSTPPSRPCPMLQPRFLFLFWFLSPARSSIKRAQVSRSWCMVPPARATQTQTHRPRSAVPRSLHRRGAPARTWSPVQCMLIPVPAPCQNGSLLLTLQSCRHTRSCGEGGGGSMGAVIHAACVSKGRLSGAQEQHAPHAHA